MRLFLTFLVAVAALTSGNMLVDADGPNRAGIVVSFGDGRVESVCVEFDEAEISGAELLNRAGFPVVSGSGGDSTAVCMIDDTGCRNPADCWCRCHGADCLYWSYHTLEGGDWRYSAVGSSQRRVRDGDADGWAWGKGGVGSGAKPEPRTFDEICPRIATSTPLPASTSSPAITPEWTSEVAAATAAPLATVAVGQSPSPPAATPTALSTKLPAKATAPATVNEDGSGFPWQLPAFAVLAVGLLGTAAVLARRRSRG